MSSQDWIEVQIMNNISRGGHGRPGKLYSITYITFDIPLFLKGLTDWLKKE
jgi:hypothetical protein